MALITAAEARLVIDALTGTSEDANLDILISAAGGLIASWCRFPASSIGAAPTMESATHTIYLDGPDPLERRRLVLPVRPVTAIASIHDAQSGTWDYGSSDLVDSGQYVTTFGDRGEIWLKPSATHAWGAGPRNIRVICTAGYVSVPEPIKQACRVVVKWMWDERRSQGLQAMSMGGYTEGHVAADARTIPMQARILLAPYRLGEVVAFG